MSLTALKGFSVSRVRLVMITVAQMLICYLTMAPTLALQANLLSICCWPAFSVSCDAIDCLRSFMYWFEEKHTWCVFICLDNSMPFFGWLLQSSVLLWNLMQDIQRRKKDLPRSPSPQHGMSWPTPHSLKRGLQNEASSADNRRLGFLPLSWGADSVCCFGFRFSLEDIRRTPPWWWETLWWKPPPVMLVLHSKETAIRQGGHQNDLIVQEGHTVALLYGLKKIYDH